MEDKDKLIKDLADLFDGKDPEDAADYKDNAANIMDLVHRARAMQKKKWVLHIPPTKTEFDHDPSLSDIYKALAHQHDSAEAQDMAEELYAYGEATAPGGKQYTLEDKT